MCRATADDDVVAKAAAQEVASVAADQDVPATLPEQQVGPRAAEQNVVRAAADQYVVVCSAVENCRNGDTGTHAHPVVPGESVELNRRETGSRKCADRLIAGEYR